MSGRERLVVVGLDGVPEGLLRRLTADGVMPRVARLMESGSLRSMRASLPEISSVSWTSFMTGTQAGEHGVFGFTDLQPDSYAIRFPTFPQIPVPTLWDRLGERGRTSLVINQPSTYPARSIPGAIVSGFVAVDLARSVKPLHHLAELRRIGYRIDIDTMRARRDHDWLFRDLHQTLEMRGRAVEQLWSAVDWDLLQVVVTGTDRLYHFLFDALDDPEHPRHRQALDYHRSVDAFVGRILDRFVREGGSRERFWMLSDHGFCAIEQEVQLNAWLREQGWLSLDGDDLESIAAGSLAFVLDPGRIYVHRAGRYPLGGVTEEEVPAVKRRVAERLRQLRYDGKPVIREVFDGVEIYAGPQASRGPDLVALAHPGFDLKGSPAASRVFGRTDLVGMHTYDDAFLLSPRPLEGDLWIGDIAEILLRELDA